ncbi:myosin-M heavy chain-like protein [Perilla frutescens var. hirtella]|nr:myosin-M heavy chain-like protein [Perilla frutescens var. frutescens]KAH6776322.1 myosin-M heavy chain-like protein [Perilla frutescens var. hirtella]
MDGGDRHEEPSLPPDYVSLAQLQERWLQKQEEKKLKQKQEEEEKRERDARAAQNEKIQNQNQNQRGMRNDGRPNMAGDFVREKGVIQDKGKGKEIVNGGPGVGVKNDKKRGGRKNRRSFQRAATVVPKEKAEVDAEELSGGDAVMAGILSSGVGGVGGGLNGVGGKRSVSVEVLPRNRAEEISYVKRIDLRGGLRGNGRNWGLSTVNELKQSEMSLNLEKMEGEKGYGKKWIERPRNGGYPERLNRLQENKPVVLEGNEVDHALQRKARDKVSEFCSERNSLSVGDRNGIRGSSSNGSNKAEEVGVEGEGSKSNGDKAILEIEMKMEGEKGYGGRGRLSGGARGRNGDYPERFNRFQEHRPVVLKGNKVGLELGKNAEDDISEVSREVSSLSVGDRNGIRGRSSSKNNKAEEDRVEGEGSNGNKVVLEIEKKMEGEKGYGGRGRGGGRNGDYLERFNRFQEHRHVVLEGNKVDSKLEKKARDEVSEVRSEISSLSAGGRNGIWGRSSNGSNKAEEDRVEGEGSNGDKLVLDIKKRMEGQKGYGRRGRNGDYPERFNRFQEHSPVVLGGNKVDPKLEKKAEDGSSKAEVDRAEGGGSNGDKVALEIEKAAYHKAIAAEGARKGETGGFGKRYQIHGNRSGRFGSGRRNNWPEHSDGRCEMKPRETGMVWVKKEEKLGA